MYYIVSQFFRDKLMQKYILFILISVISSHLFVSNVYSMQIVPKASFDDKQIVSCLFNKLSLNESLHAVSALVRVNNQYNKEFNDSGFTRTYMRFVVDTYGRLEADIVK